MARCFEQSVAEQLLHGALSDEAFTEALSHAARCARCRQVLQEAARSTKEAGLLPERNLEQVQERLGLWRAARRSAALPPTPLRKGDAIDRYVVIRVVGPSEDGMVYEGYDPERERRVVIKLLDLPADDPAATNLLAMSRRLGRLAHPNVLPLLSSGGHAGHVYLVYEFIKGTLLSQYGGGESRAVVSLFVQAGRALQAVHELGLAHGNFSAASCLVDRLGQVRVLDFGVTEARIRHLAEVSAHLEDDWPAPSEDLRTEDSFIGFVPTRRAPTAPFESFILAAAPSSLGARQYAAPEVVYGAPPSALADQFAFCAALYHHLGKRSPFAGESISLWLREVLRGHCAPPPAVPGISQSAWAALARGMSAEPSARHPRMAALLARMPSTGPLASGRARAAVALSVGVAAVAGVMVARQASGGSSPACDLEAAKQWQALVRTERSLTAGIGQAAPRAKERMDEWLGQWQRETGGFCAVPAPAARQARERAAVMPASARGPMAITSPAAALEPPHQAALARVCDAAAREAFADVLQLLAAAPQEVLDRAGSVMEALPSVRQCSESPSRASLPSVVRRAEVRRRLGMLREASALVEGAPEGETLPELSWVRAQIALDRGDLVDARRSFEAVAFAAQAASDHLGSQRAMAERLALACSPTERTMWRGLLQAQESMHPDATPAAREVQWAMAQALACEGDRAAAGRLHEAVARALEGQTSAESAAAALASARARLEQGDLIGAEAAAQRAVSTYQAVHGERHPDTLAAQLAVAEARLAGASWQSAEPIIDQVAAATTAAAAAREEADAVRARAWLLRARLSALRARAESPQDALAARTQGAVRAIDPLRKAVAEYEAALGGAHPALAAAALELADALLEAARFDEAEASYRQVAGILESLGQASSPQLARARVGVALAQWGEFPPAGAREILRWGVAPVGAELEPSVEAWAFAALARRLAARGEPARAEDSFRRALTAAQLLGAGAVQSQVAAELASFAVARELPDAVALIERALELSPGAAAERPHLLATLARQLWPKDRERATTLVAEAVASFGAGSAEAEELLRWTRRQRDRR